MPTSATARRRSRSPRAAISCRNGAARSPKRRYRRSEGNETRRLTFTPRLHPGESAMDLAVHSLLVILIIGIVAGWLAGKVVRGGGFGLLGDLVVGIVGAFIASWLFPKLGVHIGTGIGAEIVYAMM